MTQNYSYTVEVSIDNAAKSKQIFGVVSVLLSLGFIMLSVFVNWLFMLAFGAFFVLGMVYLQLYNSTAKEYTYSFSKDRLVVSKKNVINRQSRMLSVMFEDVLRFADMQGVADGEDIIACDSTSNRTYELIYRENGANRRLLFNPDFYMVELLKERLSDTEAAVEINDYEQIDIS